MPTPLTSTGLFATDKASRYLQQLCKHFGHKADVRFDATSGEAALPPAPAPWPQMTHSSPSPSPPPMTKA